MVKKKYIWFSFPAFVVLGSLTMLQCLAPRKGCLLLMIKFQVIATALSVGVVMIPMAVNEIAARVDSLFGEVLMWVSLYVVGVIATYLLVLWREKNLPHLLKAKKSETSEKSQGDGVE